MAKLQPSFLLSILLLVTGPWLRSQPLVITHFPYHQPFDGQGFIPQNTQPTPGTPVISLAEGWENDQQDDPQDWALRSGPTATTGTGPSGDHPSGSGNYLLVEDGFGNFSNVSLLSPWLDLRGMICPKTSFWYHHYSQVAVSNQLHIDLLDTLGWQLDIVAPIEATSQNQWTPLTLPLSGYTGRVRLRFRVDNSLTGGQNDIALDDVRVFDDLEADLAVSDILAPLTDCGLTANESITVALSNTGCVTATPAFLRCYVNGGLVAFEPIPGGVAPGAVRTFTLPGPFDFSQPGPYQINIQVEAGNDSQYGNNSLSLSLIHHTSASALSSWQGDTVCLDGRAHLQANGLDSLVVWHDDQGLLLGSGSSWETPPLRQTTTFQASSALTRRERLGTPLADEFLTIGAFADLDPQRDLRLDSLSVHTASTDTFQLQVFLREGGYVGFEQSPAAWTQVAVISCQGQGRGNWTRLALPGLTLRAGQTYGLLIASNVPLACSTGPVDQSSAGLRIRSQAVIQSLWGPSLTNQRGWNGQLHVRTLLCMGPAQSVTALVPASARVDLGPDTTVCQSGTFSLAAGPGSSYLWSDGSSQSTLPVSQAGTYGVTKTNAAGCVSADTITLAFRPVPYLKQVIQTEPGCAGEANGELVADATGGSGPLSYQWSGGPADPRWLGLSAGTYSLTVTDSAGCQLDTSLVLSEPDGMQLSTQLHPPLCASDSTGAIDLQVSGGTPPYQIGWSHGFTGEDPTHLPPGIYQASATDDRGCLQLSPALVLEAELGQPEALFSYQIDGDSVLFFNESLAADQFSWQFGDSSPAVSGPDPVHVFPGPGTYVVTLVAVSPCGTDTVTQTLSLFPVGVAESSRSRLAFGREGATHWLIPAGSGPLSVSLLDAQGRQLSRQTIMAPVPGQRHALSLPKGLPVGLYAWRVVQGNQVFWHKWQPQR